MTAARTGGGPGGRWTRRLVAAWCLLVLLLVVAMQGLADRWWPATVLMFAPRWPWALPLALLLPMALLWHRRALLALLPASALLALAVLGFNLPTPWRGWPRDGASDLRIASYNIGEARVDSDDVARWLAAVAPDVAALQECYGPTQPAVEAMASRGWQVSAQGSSCVLSRYPIRSVQLRNPEGVQALGGNGVAARYVIELPGRPLTLVNLHLQTVRRSLQRLLRIDPSAPEAMADNLAARELDSLLARQFVRESGGALVVTGDFNMPVESAIYRRDWGDLVNAFSTVGWGFGHTKFTNWHGIRIDHVLAGPGWTVESATVGPDLGGDHRPMVVELSAAGTR